MSEGDIGKEAEFNQAKFEMERLHELLQRIDRCNINLLHYDYELGMYQYEIVFNDLVSVLSLISSKLKLTEKEDMIKFKGIISLVFEACPVWRFILIESIGKTVKRREINKANFDMIKDLLFQFRLDLEDLMNEHKIGNPTKSDPRRAIVSN